MRIIVNVAPGGGVDTATRIVAQRLAERMTARPIIYAVVPVKDTQQAKQRLAGVLDRAQRQELALAMLEDVLAVLARVDELAGILVVTADAAAAAIAAHYRAGVMEEGAHDGHTGAVAAAAGRLVGDGM